MVQILLRFIRAEREGIWSLHLASLNEMVPYMFEYDHNTYARWVPIYLSDMQNLPSSAPEVFSEFEAGNFVVKRAHGSFNQIWTDMALEQSINKHAKGHGGLTGMTRKKQAVEKWHITAHSRAEISQSVRNMSSVSKDSTHQCHKEIGTSRCNRDENDVQKIYKYAQHFENPFISSSQLLVNVVTGVEASSVVTRDLINAKVRGKHLYELFVKTLMVEKNIPVHDPIKRTNSLTFASMNKNIKVDKVKSIETDFNFFKRILVVSQQRDINLKDIFEHELSDVPLALAKPDGSLAKCVKSAMISEIEKFLPKMSTTDSELSVTQSATCCIIDGMADLYCMKFAGAETFGQLADIYLRKMMSRFREKNCNRVDVVFDRYDSDFSIKAGEQTRRGQKQGQTQKVKGPDTKISMKWATFVKEKKNKQELTNFLGQFWAQHAPEFMKPNEKFVVAGGFASREMAVFIEKDKTSYPKSLESSHEEADSRIVFHAAEAVKAGYSKIIVDTPDTDVLILLVHFAKAIGGEIYVRLHKNQKIFPAHLIAESMGQLLCQIVLPFHALTGCDTTSAFANKGKKMPWELIKSSPMKYGKLCDIGSSPVNETYPVVKDFILNMYQPYNSKLNQTVSACKDIRYKLFAAKGCRLKDLPPTEDALMQHLKRVDYQVKIWKASLEAKPIFPCPVSTGAWHVDESLKLVPTYITTEPVPERILQIIKCSCSKSRCAKTCACLKQGLPCTDACQCEGGDRCDNRHKLLKIKTIVDEIDENKDDICDSDDEQ